MTLDDWFDQYKPIDNLSGERFGLGIGERDRIVHSHWGEDLEAVSNADPDKVWTLLDCDGIAIITNGFHHVNRDGYLISEISFEGDDIEIYFDEDDRLTDLDTGS